MSLAARTGMREMHVEDPGAADAAVDVLRHAPVLVQMPAVFVLLAPPTRRGVDLLDGTKDRLPGKNYGTALGSLGAFAAMVRAGTLPPELEAPRGLAVLTGAFVRASVAPDHFASTVIRSGTHQGVLVDGPHRSLFRALEAALLDQAEPGLFGGHRFGAPLCTSANVSGHPDGSITAWDRAYAFGRERGLPLVIRCEPAVGEAGSYPIFWLRRDRVEIAREGPGMQELQARLPQRLFTEQPVG